MLLVRVPRMGHAAWAFQVVVWDTVLAALKPVVAAVPVCIDMVCAAGTAVADLENYQALTYLADDFLHFADRGSLDPGKGCCNEPAVLGHHRHSYLASQVLLYYCAFFINI
jgi:hypothetical protein